MNSLLEILTSDICEELVYLMRCGTHDIKYPTNLTFVWWQHRHRDWFLANVDEAINTAWWKLKGALTTAEFEKITVAVRIDSKPHQKDIHCVKTFLLSKPDLSATAPWAREMLMSYPLVSRAFGQIDRYLCPFDGFRIEEGWSSILDKLLAWMEEDASRIKNEGGSEVPYLAQVKEKMGTLRVYRFGIPPDARDAWAARVDEAYQQSEVTCEVCGAPGTLCQKRGLRVRCKSCNDRNL